MKRNVEILAPAGSFECLKAAIKGGANAIYLGGAKFGARAFADNFTEDKLIEALHYAHLHNVKIYLTINTLFKNEELEELYDYLLPYYKEGLDAVIVQDIGLMDYLKNQFPDLPLHVSTQATVTNYRSALYFKEKNATRIVPARELSLSEVRQIKEETGLEVECFVHGALCYCYSGQCLLSSYIGGRSGNRGKCAQPCRLNYKLKKYSNQNMDFLSLKDLCTIEMIPELVEAGIDSFKIEGRMKQPEYVYIVTKLYRKYTDLYLEHGKKQFKVNPKDLSTLMSAYQRRGYTQGYYRKHNGKDMLSLKQPAGKVQGQENTIEIPTSDTKMEISAKVVLNSTTASKLYLSNKKAEICLEGAIPEKAKSAPVTKERIASQIMKSGNTPFKIVDVDIDMKEDLFIPMKQLNDLRRRGTDQFEKEILSKYERKSLPQIQIDNIHQKAKDASLPAENCIADQMSGKERPGKYTALVTTLEQYEEVEKSTWISTVYIDFALAFSKCFLSLLQAKKSQKKIFLAMPYIFREETIHYFEKIYDQLLLFDGVLIRNLESLFWLKKKDYQNEIHSDDHLYAFNKLSKYNLRNLGISNFTAPMELNFFELKNLNISFGTFVMYGYQPSMITANCLQKTGDVCKHTSAVLYLTDRQNKNMPVRTCCEACYNVIYNSLPHMLFGQMDKIKSLNASQYRMDFTIESKSETKTLLNLFERCYSFGEVDALKDMDYTNGHFKRGVK